MQVFINHMLFQRTVMQLRTLKFAMIEFALSTVKNLKIGLKVSWFIFQKAKMFIIKLSSLQDLQSFVSVKVV